MSFFFAEDQEAPKSKSGRKQLTVETLHSMGCKACPLDKLKGLLHPKMKATGADRPLVMILGEAPGKTEDKLGKQFVGESGQLLRPNIPEKYEDQIRWQNTINCSPPSNKTPAQAEVECCRPRLIADIELTRPRAIFGLGGVSLNWAVGEEGITKWRGRYFPIKVGNHTCWFFPTFHPSYLLRRQRVNKRTGRKMLSEDEKVWQRDLKRAFKLVEKLPDAEVVASEEIEEGVSYVTGEGGWQDVDRVKEALAHFAELPDCAFDYETASDERGSQRQTRPYGKGARILSVAVGTKDEAFAFPLHHREAGWTEKQRKAVIDAWTAFLATPNIKIAQNLFFELEWSIYFWGLKMARISKCEDTMAQAYVLDSRKGMLSLDTLILLHFGFHLKAISKVNLTALDQEPIEKVLRYNALDAKWEHALKTKQRQLLRDEGLEELYYDQLRRIPTMALKSHFGMLIDFNEVIAFDKKYSAQIKALRKWFVNSKTVAAFEKKFERKFRPGSDKDVLDVLRGILNRNECRVEDLDNPGQYKWSSKDEVLGQIPLNFARKLREYRAVTGNKSKYIDPLLPKGYKPALVADKPVDVGKCIWPDGRTHAVIQTLLLVTRRTSCTYPNEQFWPKRDDDYKDLRREFIAPTDDVWRTVVKNFGYTVDRRIDPDDCWFIPIDQGQIEARVAGMASKDRVYCTYLWDRNDIHMEWTKRLAYAYPRRIGGKEYLKDAAALKKFRTDVKNQWTFPLIFGASVPSVAKYLHMPVDIIGEQVDDFWEMLPGLKGWQDTTIGGYNCNGYVETLTGWRRYAPISKNQLINTPIQGSASDITISAMNRLSEAAQEMDLWQFQARLEVHDELGFWIPKKTFDRDLEFIADAMLECRHYPWINVPLCIEVSKGPNWYDVKPEATLFADDFGKIDRHEQGF